jgi:predicted NAD-dependent protein-ADP-ribosyltransferase YbiA (DUF1768 family)
MNTIKFYRVSEPYGEFSNFVPFPDETLDIKSLLDGCFAFTSLKS